MPFLYNIAFGENRGKALLVSEKEIVSVVYHNIFGFPLTAGELIKWTVGERVIVPNWQEKAVETKNGYYFLKGNASGIYTRLLKERISQRKIKLAKRAAKFLSLIPMVKMIAVTGALAMENAADENDIDLLIITKKGSLWTTRLVGYLVSWLAGIKIRKPGDKNQKDKLCLNIWLDEKALAWERHDRNLFTAHEIAQIKPLVNKDKTYEKFIAKNKWILAFWPNAVRIKNLKFKMSSVSGNGKNYNSKFKILETFAYKLQYLYMKSKITREVVTPTRALFHPNDWGKVVLRQFSS